MLSSFLFDPSFAFAFIIIDEKETLEIACLKIRLHAWIYLSVPVFHRLCMKEANVLANKYSRFLTLFEYTHRGVS